MNTNENKSSDRKIHTPEKKKEDDERLVRSNSAAGFFQ